MSYPRHDAALAYAVSQLNVHEDPWGSNRGPLQRWHPQGGVDFYEAHDFVNGNGYPWCVDLDLTAWFVAGRPLPYKSPSAYGQLKWAKAAGWVRPLRDCIPGDLLVWHVGAGHMNMLERLAGNVVHCIDGNHSNMVARTTRSIASLAGAIHVPEAIVNPLRAPPEPYWVITTSENGKRVLVFSKFATEKAIAGMLPRLLAKYGRHGITIRRGGVRKKKP